MLPWQTAFIGSADSEFAIATWLCEPRKALTAQLSGCRTTRASECARLNVYAFIGRGCMRVGALNGCRDACDVREVSQRRILCCALSELVKML